MLKLNCAKATFAEATFAKATFAKAAVQKLTSKCVESLSSGIAGIISHKP